VSALNVCGALRDIVADAQREVERMPAVRADYVRAQNVAERVRALILADHALDAAEMLVREAEWAEGAPLTPDHPAMTQLRAARLSRIAALAQCGDVA
jgi:hypothetical protein